MIQRILFVSLFKEGSGGGEGRVAYEMARAFAGRYDVVMLCPGTETGLTTDKTGFKQFHIRSVDERNLAVPLLSSRNIQQIFRFLDDFRPDVIHIHDPAMLDVIAQLWGKLHHVPVFYTAHILPGSALDFGTREAANFFADPFNDMLVERYLLNFYQNCDAVIGLNEHAAAEVREFGYPGPVLLIPNGRNLKQFHSCQFADITQTEKQLTFVGFLSKRKNQTFLLEVMQQLPPQYKLVLIGEPLVPDYEGELADMVNRHNLNVVFTGQLTQKEIAEQLEKTHVFVSASKMEVQSLVVIEALASGTPVVGLSNETVDELVDESDGARLPKEATPAEFAAMVERVCRMNAADYQRMCEAARKRVDTLDWSNVVTHTVENYEAILAQRALQAQPANVIDLDFLNKYLLQFPEGKLRSELWDAMASFQIQVPSLPRARQAHQTANAFWIAVLNIIAAVAGYYVLVGPVRLVRKSKNLPGRK